jgi:hypothetical protein
MVMEKHEQRRFVKGLINNIHSEIETKIAKGQIPESWDGHELRKYLADRFADAVIGSYMTDKKCRRYREYKNTVMVNNL